MKFIDETLETRPTISSLQILQSIPVSIKYIIYYVLQCISHETVDNMEVTQDSDHENEYDIDVIITETVDSTPLSALISPPTPSTPSKSIATPSNPTLTQPGRINLTKKFVIRIHYFLIYYVRY